MAITIYTLSIFSLVYFIYEGIIVPSFRSELRYKFFKVRDRLRMLKIEQGDEIDEEVFKYMDQSINAGIKLIPALNLSSYLRSRDELKDEKILKKVHERMDLIINNDDAELGRIYEKTIKYSTIGFALNLGGILIFLSPLIILVLLLVILIKLPLGVKKQIQEISIIPDYRFNVIFTETEVDYELC